MTEPYSVQEQKAQETLRMTEILRERALVVKEDGTIDLADVSKHMTQIFTSFANFSGAVRESVEKPGLWEIFAPQVDQRGNPVGVAKVYFRASQILAVGVPFEVSAPKIQVVGAIPPTRTPLNGGHR